jgi:hypothetical protein
MLLILLLIIHVSS